MKKSRCLLSLPALRGGGIKPRYLHPAGAVIDRQILILRLLLLTLLLLGAVAAIEAAGGGAKHAMVTSVMTGDAADCGALQATLGFGALGRNGERGNNEQCGYDFHDGAFL